MTWNGKPLSIKRFIIWGLGLFIMSFGVAFAVDAGLGVSPVTTLPYVVSRTVGVSVGTGTYVAYIIFVFVEFLIYRKSFKLIYLLQIPCAIMFGYFSDLAKFLVAPLTKLVNIQTVLVPNAMGTGFTLELSSLPFNFLWLFISICLVSFGLMMYLPTEIMAIPPDALSAAVAWITKKPFHLTKRITDISFSGISFCISIIATKGNWALTLQVVFIGTILAAIFIGIMLKFWNGLFGEKIQKILWR